jgi:hypothetical protein
MKRKILSIIKKQKSELIAYKTERSDMGVQTFEIEYKNINGKYFRFSDGYFVGSGINGDYILYEFSKHITKANILQV